MATKNLVEAYKNRIAFADNFYAQNHNGKRMDDYKKVLIASSLNNVSNFLNEAFEQSAGTQRAALGDYKRFCLTLTTLALPTMIAPEIVLTVPMASRTGFITYLNYTAGSNKGGVTRGKRFNSVWQLGEMDEARQNYTAAAVIDPFTGDGTTAAFNLMWTPVPGTVKVTVAGVDQVEGTDYDLTIGHEKRFEPLGPSTAVVPVDGTSNSQNATATVTFKAGHIPADGAAIRIGYEYDNIVVPQDDIPTLNAELAEVTLTAKARRIAVNKIAA